MTDQNPAPPQILTPPKRPAWLFTWRLALTLGVTITFVGLLFAITGNGLGDTPLGNAAAAACGMLGALGVLTTFVHAHFSATRRTYDPDRDLAHLVLVLGYALIFTLTAGYFLEWKPERTSVDTTIGTIAIFGVIGIILVAVAYAMDWIGATPHALDVLYRELPTVDEYMAAHPPQPGRPIACHKCNSYRIHHYGLIHRRDPRRVHRCQSCNTTLYKTRGLNY